MKLGGGSRILIGGQVHLKKKIANYLSQRYLEIYSDRLQTTFLQYTRFSATKNIVHPAV